MAYMQEWSTHDMYNNGRSSMLTLLVLNCAVLSVLGLAN